MENDPKKELFQILKEDMKHSRELEIRYFHWDDVWLHDS